MKLHFYFSILALLGSLQAVASGEWSALPRYVESIESTTDIPVFHLPTLPSLSGDLQHCDAYIFEDIHSFVSLMSPNKDGNLTEKLESSAALFDRVIFPKFLSLFQPSDFKTSIPQIVIVFDDMDSNSIHRGYVSRRYPSERGIYVMVIDTKTAGTPNFSILAAHELQHLFSYYFSRQAGSSQYQADWLNEGLSKFMELYISGVAPDVALQQFEDSGQTTNLWSWPEGSLDTENNYSAAFLWVSYLYYHFGREELLRHLISDPRVGMESILGNLSDLSKTAFSIPSAFLTESSLFANFALSLAINSRIVGLDQLLSLSNDQFVPQLEGFKMRPKLVVPEKIGNSLEFDFKIGPRQALYLNLADPTDCWAISAASSVYGYWIQSTTHSDSDTNLFSIARAESTQSISTALISPSASSCTIIPVDVTQQVVLVNDSDQEQAGKLIPF